MQNPCLGDGGHNKKKTFVFGWVAQSLVCRALVANTEERCCSCVGRASCIALVVRCAAVVRSRTLLFNYLEIDWMEMQNKTALNVYQILNTRK